MSHQITKDQILNTLRILITPIASSCKAGEGSKSISYVHYTKQYCITKKIPQQEEESLFTSDSREAMDIYNNITLK